MFAAAAHRVAGGAPDRIPRALGRRGEVDRYGGKFEGLLRLPLIALGHLPAMRFLPNLDPGRANYARFGGVYATIRVAMLALMAAIHGAVLFSILRTARSTWRWPPRCSWDRSSC